MNKSHNGMVTREHLRSDQLSANSPAGNRSGFQTDTGISGGRLGDRRELQRWDAGGPGSNGLLDGGLEDSKDSSKPWDQFAVNAEKFGVQTDYDENIYTTSIDRSRPDYNERVARAERLARKIEGSTATSAHAAEERVVDHAIGGAEDGLDEEEKYDFDSYGLDHPANSFTGTAVSNVRTSHPSQTRPRTSTLRLHDVPQLATQP